MVSGLSDRSVNSNFSTLGILTRRRETSLQVRPVAWLTPTLMKKTTLRKRLLARHLTDLPIALDGSLLLSSVWGKLRLDAARLTHEPFHEPTECDEPRVKETISKAVT